MQDQVRPDARKVNAGMYAVRIEQHLTVEHLAKVRNGEAGMRASDEVERDGPRFGDARAGDHVSATALDVRACSVSGAMIAATNRSAS